MPDEVDWEAEQTKVRENADLMSCLSDAKYNGEAVNTNRGHSGNAHISRLSEADTQAQRPHESDQLEQSKVLSQADGDVKTPSAPGNIMMEEDDQPSIDHRGDILARMKASLHLPQLEANSACSSH